MTAKFEATVVAVGEQVEQFISRATLVLFQAGAPEELAEFSILHEPAVNDDGIEAGDLLRLADESYLVLAVGSVANQNLKSLGHLVIKANGRTEPEMPGDVCVEAKPLVTLDVGDLIRIEGRPDR